jgi:hypothetical protein
LPPSKIPESAPEPVNVSTLAESIAGVLRSLPGELNNADYEAESVRPVERDTQIILKALHEKLYSSTLSFEAEQQVQLAVDSLQDLLQSARLLLKTSEDIANNTEAGYINTFRRDWGANANSLIKEILPTSRVLISLSKTARNWDPIAVNTDGATPGVGSSEDLDSPFDVHNDDIAG